MIPARSLSLVALCSLVAQTTAVVLGTQSNGIGTRMEIRQLLRNHAQWNIYLLGLSAMQNASQSDESSYYTIAAIHGLPQGTYDGYDGVSNPAFPAGYCTHDSNYFPTWHRAYTRLFEQTLQSYALSQAQLFSGSAQTQYTNAANALRSPYLDWTQTTGGSAYPAVFDHPTATVYVPGPNGNTVKTTIPNPLYAYHFSPPVEGLYWSPYNQDTLTARNPDDPNTVDSPSNQAVTRAAVDKLQPALHDRLYKVLTNYTDYNQISNDAWVTSGANVDTQDSLESIHNDFHNFVGGAGGHMQPLPTAAYDPIFWLHHTMVDRSMALWQALHPNSWLEPQTQVTPSYWYNVGDESGSSTGLMPFAKNENRDLWTSDELRDWTVLGYTYPELQSGWTNVTVRAAIDALYSASEDPSITGAAPNTGSSSSGSSGSGSSGSGSSGSGSSGSGSSGSGSSGSGSSNGGTTGSGSSNSGSTATSTSLTGPPTFGAPTPPTPPTTGPPSTGPPSTGPPSTSPPSTGPAGPGPAGPGPANNGPAKPGPPGPGKRSLFDDLEEQYEEAVMESYEYFINVRASKNALLQPYSVFAFFGEPPSRSRDFITAPNLAGLMGVAAPLLTPEQGASRPTVYTTSTIPLNRALKDAHKGGDLQSTTPDHITSYLTEKLNWLVLANNGTILEANHVPDLLLSVGQTVSKDSGPLATIAGLAQRLRHKSSSLLAGITNGKPGGLCNSEAGLYSGGSSEMPIWA